MSKVKEALESCKKARNDDLWNYLLVGFLEGKLTMFEMYNKLKTLKSYETCRRARQVIQGAHPELRPTDPKVIEVRKRRQQQMHDTAGRYATF